MIDKKEETVTISLEHYLELIESQKEESEPMVEVSGKFVIRGEDLIFTLERFNKRGGTDYFG